MSRYQDKHLSPWRVILGIAVLGALLAGSFYGVMRWNSEQLRAERSPWFASYVDITATPAFAFEQENATNDRDVVLSFIVALPDETCTPSWGAAYTLDQASATLDLDRRIERFRQQDRDVAVSFGGLINDELAVTCKDVDKLTAAYRAVVDRYDIDTIDLDLEQSGLTDPDAAKRRAQAIANLQNERRANGKSLAVWVTLPVTTQGLSEDGTNGVTHLLEGNVDLAGINAMTMNFGDTLTDGQSMADGSKSALVQTHRQLGVLYQRTGTYLNDATLWSKLGVTPMIGQNDNDKEIFTLEDAKILNEFAASKNITRMSMWSVNRDVSCGGNYVDLKVASDSCSGVPQKRLEFTQLLSAKFEGDLALNAGIVTQEDQATELTSDDPATSPYPIWNEENAYLQGTKVVWRHNVYEAKWWTQGDTPDNPVLQIWETPWRLVGPVLEGETPIKQATVPDGTYPVWSGADAYDTGARVMFEGTPYQAKWWNRGESPAVASSSPNGSPWAPLTQEQINAINQKKTQ